MAADVYLEKVVAPKRFSVTARLYSETGGDGEERREADLLGKLAFAPRPGTSFALAAGPIHVEAPEGACAGGGVETRGAIGISARSGAYFAVEAAQRRFAEGCADQRAEASLGVTSGAWLGLAQVFADRERFGAEATAQLSAVVFLERRLGLQFGVRVPLGGGARVQDAAIVVGLWAKGARTR